MKMNLISWIFLLSDEIWDTIVVVPRGSIHVSHFGSFGLKVSLVVFCNWSQKRNSSCNFQTISLQSTVFSRIICHQLHCSHSQISQYLHTKKNKIKWFHQNYIQIIKISKIPFEKYINYYTWAPMPYSLESTGKPSSSLASTVSRPSSCKL